MNLNELIHTGKNARLVVLIDPDKFNPALVELADKGNTSFFLVGGSRLKKNNIRNIITQIRKRSNKPVIIFPGDEKQICGNADGLLMLSLISGKNPEFLIGKHIKAAPLIKKHKLQTLPVGYILVNGQKTSTTQKVTKTKALDPKQISTICNIAAAGELLGLQAIYLEAGSGAKQQVNVSVIKAVKKHIRVPLFVGGGIDSFLKAKQAVNAGADLIVVGNALEKNLYLLPEIEKAFN